MPETYSIDATDFGVALALCEATDIKSDLQNFADVRNMEELTETDIQDIQIALWEMTHEFAQKVEAVMALLPTGQPPRRRPIVP